MLYPAGATVIRGTGQFNQFTKTTVGGSGTAGKVGAALAVGGGLALLSYLAYKRYKKNKLRNGSGIKKSRLYA